ncbi:type IV pilin protein [Parahaliea mediterranea]|uniref:type IV pilin protein n=1 Tax=Parahaliea mediterranea TaxID=651086 RepID=UPI0014766023|nr:type IV pilin protein [Parahaliea mediterranea]
MISRGWRCSAAAGFSLLEILIALCIVGLLLGVALPGYERQLQRVKRSTAIAALEGLRARQEQFFAHHRRYAETFAELGLGDSGDSSYSIDGQGAQVAADAPQRSYRIALEDVTPGAYVLRAAAQLRQRRDSLCVELEIDHRGKRGAAPGTVADCW